MSKSDAGYRGLRDGFLSLAAGCEICTGRISLIFHEGHLRKLRLEADVPLNGSDGDLDEYPRLGTRVKPGTRKFAEPDVAAYLHDKCGPFGRASAEMKKGRVAQIVYRRKER